MVHGGFSDLAKSGSDFDEFKAEFGVEWSGVEWGGVEWSGVECSGVDWSGVQWSGVQWSGVVLNFP